MAHTATVKSKYCKVHVYVFHGVTVVYISTVDFLNILMQYEDATRKIVFLCWKVSLDIMLPNWIQNWIKIESFSYLYSITALLEEFHWFAEKFIVENHLTFMRNIVSSLMDCFYFAMGDFFFLNNNSKFLTLCYSFQFFNKHRNL